MVSRIEVTTAVSSTQRLFQFEVRRLAQALATESHTKPNFDRFSVSWDLADKLSRPILAAATSTLHSTTGGCRIVLFQTFLVSTVFPKLWDPRLTRRIKTPFIHGWHSLSRTPPPGGFLFGRKALRAFARALALCYRFFTQNIHSLHLVYICLH